LKRYLWENFLLRHPPRAGYSRRRTPPQGTTRRELLAPRNGRGWRSQKRAPHSVTPGECCRSEPRDALLHPI